MRVVFVSDVVYPYVKGGAEKRIYELSRRLAAAGHDVHVYGVKWWEGPAMMVKEGVTYHGVCRPKALYVNGRRSIVEALWFSICLLGPLLQERFDVIDCNEHPYFPLFSCKIVRLLKGGKLFATWHEVWGNYWYEYMGKAGAVGRLIEWLATRMPDGVIAVSDRTASDLVMLGVRKERITVVPNGIPLEHIRSIPPSGEACDVIYAGRLIKDKHVDVLIRACARMPLKLTIIGDGPERASLETLATELKVPIEFTGFLAEDELVARMKAARVFVLPSTREGFGITVVEAMACGLPVVTVDAPRNYAKDLVEDGVTGRVIILDEKVMEDTIGELTVNGERKIVISPACIKASGCYDWGMLTRQLEDNYLNICTVAEYVRE